MLRFAASWESAALPMWWTSAPQQPSPAVRTTSMPWRFSRRIAGFVDAGVEHRLGAAAEQRDARLATALGARDARAVGPRNPREARGGEIEHGGETGKCRDAPKDWRQRLAEEGEDHGGAEAPRIGKDRGERAANEAIRRRPLVGLLDVGAGVIDEVHVVDARRAGRHAGEARQAAVDVGDDLLGRRLAALQHVLDQVDAAARTVELVAEQHVGRAGRGAEAAMDAAAQESSRRRRCPDRRAGRG